MTKEHMDRLANEVLMETGLPFSLFASDDAQNHVWGLSFSNQNKRFFYKITIDSDDYKTDGAVKSAIRHQLGKLPK
jgi:hypothetical protein